MAQGWREMGNLGDVGGRMGGTLEGGGWERKHQRFVLTLSWWGQVAILPTHLGNLETEQVWGG